jgi:hypothetical protein
MSAVSHAAMTASTQLTEQPMNTPTPQKKSLGQWIARIAAVLGLTYVATWYAATVVLKNQAARWLDNQRDAGFTISHSAPEISGFPGRAVVSYRDLSIAAPVTRGDWTWRSPVVKIWAQAWAPFRFTIDLSGVHTLSGVWTPPGVPADIAARTAWIKPTLTNDGRLSEVAAAVEFVTGSGGAATPELFVIEAGSLSVSHANDTWRVVTDLINWRAPFLEGAGMPGKARKLAFNADLKGPLHQGTLPDALKAWRENGGTLEVHDFSIDWPPLAASATGTLALDAKLQPVGALTAKFRGFVETLDAMADSKTLNRDDADTAQAVLSLLAKRPEGGGAPELSISVTVQDQKLYLGPVVLAEIEDIVWPETIRIP